ncbi:MAG: DNA repair protein RecN [Desulfobulbaceae bacterium DB1]|nr:MAG: DNA repair protein RecN [Desulfobulbaceae bacterium DB1]
MLCELHIANLALIEKLSLSFNSGLSVLTGETGAGKSIILQAIHLLSGGKGAASWVRNGAESAVIEALFEVGDEQAVLVNRLREQGFEAEGAIILKRVLSDQGRSRFYVNGSPATARITGELAEELFSLASQHDHQQLLIPRFHLDFVDAVGDIWSQRAAFGELYDVFQQKKSEHQTLLQKEKDKEQRKDFLSFQLNEIVSAGVVEGEDEKLVSEKDRLKSADELTRLGRKSYSLLYDATGSFSQLRKNLGTMAALDPLIAPLAEEVSGYTFQLEDKVHGLRAYLDGIPDDPGQLEDIVGRLDLLSRLKRKYGPELSDVIDSCRKAAEELEEIEALDHRLDGLARELQVLGKKLLEGAADLSARRREVAHRLAETIRAELVSLSLEQAVFEIDFPGGEMTLSSLGRTGADKPVFMFSANRGEPVKPIAQIASGGELSRLLLALKCLLARKDQVETVIFDEVDTGISGKAAESVARKIRELASHHQVLCITHLPQIASCADDHYRVSKSVENDRTRTAIVKLDKQQRVAEIAAMLDGSSVTPRTLAYAAELINRNSQ